MVEILVNKMIENKKAAANSALEIGFYELLRRKYLLLLKINLASGFGCFASVSPIAKGAKR
jgi:hypothetical protein